MPAPARSSLRYDLEGLRGVAIALVVIFHVFVGRVSSGVDVFLLLGGIFFFSSQLSNARNPQGLTVLQAIWRMVRRLFPQLAVATLGALALGLVTLPRLARLDLAEDATAAIGYYINWRLAFSGREYAAVRTDVSPFQHLWSMSVQLQIYLASLLVITLIAALARKHAFRVLTVVLLLATAASFGYAVYLHGEDQALNYYNTGSRFWEIGLGGLVGLALRRRRAATNSTGVSETRPGVVLPAWLRWVLGIAGIAMIVMTGALVEGAQEFPGPWTLLPLVGALMVVLAGTGPEEEQVGLSRLLATRPFVWLGGISYALYLWHWPMLVLALNARDREQVSLKLGLFVIATSLVLAWLSKRLVEMPLRQVAKPQRSWLVGDAAYAARSLRGGWRKAIGALVIAAMAATVVFTGPWITWRNSERELRLWTNVENPEVYPGAESFLSNASSPLGEPVAPPLEQFERLLPRPTLDGCITDFEGAFLSLQHDHNASDEPCEYGDPNGKTMYVVGGSHSEHYFPALERIAAADGIKLIPLLKAGCPVNARITLLNGEDYADCREWSANVMDYIKEHPPEAGIFMTGTRPSTIVGQGPETVPLEYVQTVQQFSDWGIHSYLMRDTPWHLDAEGQQFDLRSCVSATMDGEAASAGIQGPAAEFPGLEDYDAPTFDEILAINGACGTPLGDSLLQQDPSVQAYAGLDVTLLDVTPAVCQNGWCPALIGNMAAYRDAHHFTPPFAESLAPEIEAQMFAPTHRLPTMDQGLRLAQRGMERPARVLRGNYNPMKPANVLSTSGSGAGSAATTSQGNSQGARRG